MRVAVCSNDTNERHTLSRITDEIMSPRGTIPKISLFPFPHELLETAARQQPPFDLILLSGHKDDAVLPHLCRLASVILIGEQELGPTAFDAGAAYFIEAPADHQKLEKAIINCLTRGFPQSMSAAARRLWLQAF